MKPEDLQSGLDLARTNWPVARKLIIDLLSPHVHPSTRHKYADALGRDVSSTVAALYFEMMATFDVRESLSKVQAPTLVFHPSQSPGALMAAGRDVALGMPSAVFRALDSGSPSTNPEGTARLISRFLDEGRSPSQPPVTAGSTPSSSLTWSLQHP